MRIATKDAVLIGLREGVTAEQRATAVRLVEAEVPAAMRLRLTEKSASAAGGAGVIDQDGNMLIRIIAPGKGSSGRYTREVLERDIPRAFPAGTPMYANHMTESESWDQPERRIEAMAGTFAEDPHYETKGAAGPGSYVKVAVVEHWAPILSALAKHGIGTSIDADGVVTIAEDGVPEIQSIVSGRSVDFVTRAGAGGTIIPLQEAARSAGISTPIPVMIEEKNVPELNPTELAKLQENLTTLTTSVTELKTANAALLLEKRSTALREASRKSATAILAGIEMPEPARARVLEAVVNAAPVTAEGALDEPAFKTLVESAATQEVTYGQAAFGYGTGNVRGNGGQAGAGGAKGATAPSKVMESLGSIRAACGL